MQVHSKRHPLLDELLEQESSLRSKQKTGKQDHRVTPVGKRRHRPRNALANGPRSALNWTSSQTCVPTTHKMRAPSAGGPRRFACQALRRKYSKSWVLHPSVEAVGRAFWAVSRTHFVVQPVPSSPSAAVAGRCSRALGILNRARGSGCREQSALLERLRHPTAAVLPNARS
jgi:hypothetical protein